MLEFIALIVLLSTLRLNTVLDKYCVCYTDYRNNLTLPGLQIYFQYVHPML